MGVQPITIPQSLAYVLNTAGDRSGVDFNYLLQTAQRESALDPSARAPSSSAVGLFQFLDQTWLQVMKEEGPRLGYQKYADAITQGSDGEYTIKDRKLRAEVLRLREDPQVAADMAAAFTRSNGAYLQAKFGRMPSPGELYIAHFLGPQGAEKLFNAGLEDADQIAAKLFPRQAKANPQIFYQDGRPRTIREVYKALVAQHDGIVAADIAPDPKFAAQQMSSEGAGSPGKWPASEVPSRFTRADMSFTALFSTETPAGRVSPLVGAEAAGPLMQSQGLPPLALAPDLASEPLAAIDSATDGAAGPDETAQALGFAPLPAPAPLLPPGESPVASAARDGSAPPADMAPANPSGAPQAGVPQPRVIMSPGPHVPNPAFFTQLVTQGGGY